MLHVSMTTMTRFLPAVILTAVRIRKLQNPFSQKTTTRMIPLAETATRKHRGIISSSGTPTVEKSHVDLAVAAGSTAACFAASTTRSIAAASRFNPSQSLSRIPPACRAWRPVSTSASSTPDGIEDAAFDGIKSDRLPWIPRAVLQSVAIRPPSIRSVLHVVLLSALIFGLLFVAQSMYIIFHHRSFFGEHTPLPISPMSGVVVALDDTQDASMYKSICDWDTSTSHHSNDSYANSQCQQVHRDTWGYTWKTFRSDPHMIAARYHALSLQPLRVLVIGDSMARGVGVGKSCNPVIPEKLALYLSKKLGGRPVYWTVRGEPGANAGRIVRELQQHPQEQEDNQEEDDYDRDFHKDDNDQSEDTWVGLDIQHNTESDSKSNSTRTRPWDESREKDTWIQRLKHYKDIHQGYDVAVVFTGMNDLKGIIFPFVLQGQDIADHLEAKKRGGGYLGELQRLLHILGFRMKKGLLEYLQKVKSKVDSHGIIDEEKWSSKVRHKISSSIDDLSARIDTFATQEQGLTSPLGPTLTESSDSGQRDQETSTFYSYRPPLVIFPMLPIQNCPGLQYGPCRHVGLALQRIFEGVKRKLTRMYPEHTLHLDGMQMVDFSARFLKGDRLIRESDIALSLLDIDADTCLRVQEEMHDFYSPHWDREQTTAEVGEDASKWNVWSPDTIHPNDNGYDMIGEFIGEETIKKWKSFG